MGYYIDRTSKGDSLPANGKAPALAAAGDILEILGPVTPPYQKDLVCILHNGPFEAAGYCFSKREYDEFRSLRDHRPRFWYIVRDAAKLSGYAQ